jgi:diguanylate cyclase (GGDEF)-like protein
MPVGGAARFLDQAESLRTADHARFLRMLDQLHQNASRLSPREQWHVRYLDAWQSSYQGDYDQADVQLQHVIDHSGDPALAAKASALLMSNLGLQRRYEDAFVLANRLAGELPTIRDRLARFSVLANLSQLLALAGQNDLALNYARMMEDTLPPGETPCNPLTKQVTALYNAKRLKSSGPELQLAIDTCQAAKQTVFTNAMWLILSSLYLDEGQPAKALGVLDGAAQSIAAGQFYSHTLAAKVERAQAYLQLGQDDNALKAARAAVAMSSPGELSGTLRDAFEVLYKVERKRGNAAATLAYYERYVAQDKGYLNDISARALAYQMAQQHVLTTKLQAETLSKQNRILKLQRALATKAVETSRLYIVLLLVVIASIVLWLFRLKRSQMRFMRLSRQDGLTGILNHQHFIGLAGRALNMLEKRVGHACLIVLDLDHFKSVNDTHGHAMGDAVLKRAVIACQQQLRPSDLFGRLGGEEFGILLHECSRQQGMDIANRIRAAIAGMAITADNCSVTVSASVGLASTDTSGYELQRLCKEADAALYRAKRAGRNCVMGDIEIDGSMARA